MLDYFVKVLLFQTLFLVVYDVVLKKETFFQWNRVYLIVTSVLAYIIPLIKLSRLTKVVPQEYVVWLPEVMLSPQTVIIERFDKSLLLFTLLKWLFFIGVMFALVSFTLRLIKLLLLIKNNEKEKTSSYKLVYLKASSAFSFFNYIFLGKQISKQNKEQIIKHELVHVKQKHSIDLLFFELQKIICWFNPYSYLYQYRISELHEFIADSIAVKREEKLTYFQNLLAETFGTQKISFINPFLNHSLIKKRIVMLNKVKSNQLLKLKYVLMLPLLVTMLLYSSCEREEEESEVEDKSTSKLILEQKFDGEEIELTNKEIKDIIDIVEKSVGEENDVERQKRIKEALQKYLLEKRRELLTNSDEIVEIREALDNGPVMLEDVPFATIEKSPVFPGCEESSDQKNCFNNNLSDFVAKNFNVDLAKSQNLKPGKKKIYVQFKITKEGRIDIKDIRAPHPNLKEEARRLVQSLPKMRPGEVNGEPVNVLYMLPISFNIE